MADDKAATGQLPATCRVPLARARESTVPPGRERYAWLYDDEDIWAAAGDDDAPPPAGGRDRPGPRG